MPKLKFYNPIEMPLEGGFKALYKKSHEGLNIPLHFGDNKVIANINEVKKRTITLAVNQDDYKLLESKIDYPIHVQPLKFSVLKRFCKSKA